MLNQQRPLCIYSRECNIPGCTLDTQAVSRLDYKAQAADTERLPCTQHPGLDLRTIARARGMVYCRLYATRAGEHQVKKAPEA